MIKFKDSDCYPIKFDLFGLVSMSDKLTFPMVWHEKYYLKKVIQIDKDSILILGRNLEEVVWTPAPEEQALIHTLDKIRRGKLDVRAKRLSFNSCKTQIAKIIESKFEEEK